MTHSCLADMEGDLFETGHPVVAQMACSRLTDIVDHFRGVAQGTLLTELDL